MADVDAPPFPPAPPPHPTIPVVPASPDDKSIVFEVTKGRWDAACDSAGKAGNVIRAYWPGLLLIVSLFSGLTGGIVHVISKDTSDPISATSTSRSKVVQSDTQRTTYGTVPDVPQPPPIKPTPKEDPTPKVDPKPLPTPTVEPPLSPPEQKALDQINGLVESHKAIVDTLNAIKKGIDDLNTKPKPPTPDDPGKTGAVFSITDIESGKLITDGKVTINKMVKVTVKSPSAFTWTNLPYKGITFHSEGTTTTLMASTDGEYWVGGVYWNGKAISPLFIQKITAGAGAPTPPPVPVPTPPVPVPPVPVPVPPVPVPTDPFTKAIQDAWTKESTADKAMISNLTGLYSQAIIMADDTTYTLVKAQNDADLAKSLFDVMHATRLSLVKDCLPNVRAVITIELNKTLPTVVGAPLDAATRITAKTEFSKIATALGGLQR